MFIVRFTPEAKNKVVNLFAQEGFEKPGVMIHRQGLRADVIRSPTGQVEWSIEHPHPWRAQVGDFQTFGYDAEDVFLFDGIYVWLALIPKSGELGVEVSIRGGELYVDEIRV